LKGARTEKEHVSQQAALCHQISKNNRLAFAQKGFDIGEQEINIGFGARLAAMLDQARFARLLEQQIPIPRAHQSRQKRLGAELLFLCRIGWAGRHEKWTGCGSNRHTQALGT